MRLTALFNLALAICLGVGSRMHSRAGRLTRWGEAEIQEAMVRAQLAQSRK